MFFSFQLSELFDFQGVRNLIDDAQEQIQKAGNDIHGTIKNVSFVFLMC